MTALALPASLLAGLIARLPAEALSSAGPETSGLPEPGSPAGDFPPGLAPDTDFSSLLEGFTAGPDESSGEFGAGAPRPDEAAHKKPAPAAPPPPDGNPLAAMWTVLPEPRPTAPPPAEVPTASALGLPTPDGKASADALDAAPGAAPQGSDDAASTSAPGSAPTGGLAPWKQAPTLPETWAFGSGDGHDAQPGQSAGDSPSAARKGARDSQAPPGDSPLPQQAAAGTLQTCAPPQPETPPAERTEGHTRATRPAEGIEQAGAAPQPRGAAPESIQPAETRPPAHRASPDPAPPAPQPGPSAAAASGAASSDSRESELAFALRLRERAPEDSGTVLQARVADRPAAPGAEAVRQPATRQGTAPDAKAPAGAPAPAVSARGESFSDGQNPAGEDSHAKDRRGTPQAAPQSAETAGGPAASPDFRGATTEAGRPAAGDNRTENRSDNRTTAAPARAGEVRSDSLRPPAAARDIRLVLGGSEHPVQVRLVERAGDVHVDVRTPDARLAGDLRQQLPALTARLEDSGFHAQAWHPASAAAHRTDAIETRAVLADAGQDSNPRDGRHNPKEGDPRQPKPAEPKSTRQDRRAFAGMLGSIV